MRPRQLFPGRVSIATGVRDGTTNKNKRFTGFRPQLTCLEAQHGFVLLTLSQGQEVIVVFGIKEEVQHF